MKSCWVWRLLTTDLQRHLCWSLKLPVGYSNPYYKQLLSQRELEALKWLSEGHRNDRIADNMNIASVTVNYHLREIKRKLGAQTREQAVAIAFRKGMLR